jgi:O-antigen/teichoic acid export membrane protein
VVFLGSVAQKAIGVVSLIVLAHVLGVRDLGAWTFAAAFTTFFTTVADLGIDGVATRELVARGDDERGVVLGSAMVAKTAAGILAVVVATAIAWAYSPSLRWPAVAAVAAILSTVPGTVSLLFAADVRPLVPTLVRTAGAVLATGAVIVAAAAGMGVTALVLIQTGIGYGTSFAVYLVVRRLVPVRLGVDRQVTRELVVAGLPLAAATVGIVVFMRVDQLLLGALSTRVELARYGVAVRVVDAFNVIPIALGAVALPALTSRRDGGAARLSAQGFRWLASAILPVAALGTVAGGPLLGEVFGHAYRSAGTTFALLLWAHYFAFSWVLARQVLLALGRTGKLAVLALAAAALNVVLNVALIPAHGAKGAALASLIAYGAPFAVSPFVPALREELSPAIAAAIRPAIAVLVLLPTLVLVRTIVGANFVLVAAFVVLAPLALALTGSLTRADIDRIRRATRPAPVT